MLYHLSFSCCIYQPTLIPNVKDNFGQTYEQLWYGCWPGVTISLFEAKTSTNVKNISPFIQWQQDGTWQVMHDLLRGDVRVAAGKHRHPSARIIDSQSVKTTEKGGSAAWVWALRPWRNVRIEVVKRLEGLKGFHVLPKRWIVERTFAWLNRYRRLSEDYEYLT